MSPDERNKASADAGIPELGALAARICAGIPELGALAARIQTRIAKPEAGAVDPCHAPEGYVAEAAYDGCRGCARYSPSDLCPHFEPEDGHVGCIGTDRPDGRSVIFRKAGA